MMKFLKFILLVPLFIGCSPYIPSVTVNQMGMLEKGTDIGVFINENSNYKIEVEFVDEFNVKGKDYKVLFSQVTAYKNISRVFLYIAFTFEDDKLSFFGYPYEYRRTHSEELNILGDKIFNSIKDYEEGNADFRESFKDEEGR